MSSCPFIASGPSPTTRSVAVNGGPFDGPVGSSPQPTSATQSTSTVNKIRVIRALDAARVVSSTDLYHSAGAVSRLAALLIVHICPICSLFAPCQTGASPASVYSSVELTALARRRFGGIAAVEGRARAGGAREQPSSIRKRDVSPIRPVRTVNRLIALDEYLSTRRDRVSRPAAAYERPRRTCLDHPALPRFRPRSSHRDESRRAG